MSRPPPPDKPIELNRLSCVVVAASALLLLFMLVPASHRPLNVPRNSIDRCIEDLQANVRLHGGCGRYP